MALAQPHTFLPGLPAELGVTAAQEDACLAYRLFDQVLQYCCTSTAAASADC
jgi:hypothetical protein